MKAIVYRDTGSAHLLQCAEIEKPSPGDDEVLIRVRAASVNPLDWRLLKAHPFLRRMMFKAVKAKVLQPGVDVSGVVEAVGSQANQFKPGDEVFGSCHGAFAEYARAPQKTLCAKPGNVTFAQAASAPVAALTALQGLRDKGRIQPGHKVLINGAAGGVGTFAVQIAKSLGAHVTAVCSTRNLEMVRGIGADRVVDYTREDFASDGQRYDLILDCYANHSLSAYRRILNPSGIYVGVGGPIASLFGLLGGLLAQFVLSRVGGRKFVTFIAKINRNDLAAIGDLIAGGRVSPVIDRQYQLQEVPEAVRYLEEGHARGKVVISLEELQRITTTVPA